MSPELSLAGLALAFGAGIASFVSPCTLPLVPSYLSFITGASLSDLRGDSAAGARGRALRHSLMFVLGFSLVFTLLGLGASALGQRVRELQPYLMKGGGVLLVIMGLHYMRVIRVPFLDMEKKAHLQQKPAGYLGSLAVGVVFSAGYSPCVGPWLAGLLLMAAGSTTTGAVALLVAYCLGFGVPFVLAAAALDRFLSYSNVLKRNMTPILRASGALLILVGVGMYFNLMTLLIPSQGAVFAQASPVRHITGETFEAEVLRSDLPVLMDVSATWCVPCREMAPVVERVARQYRGKLKVVTIDFDRNRSLVERYGVQGLPNLITLKSGRKVGANLQGVIPQEELSRRLAANLGLERAEAAEEDGAEAGAATQEAMLPADAAPAQAVPGAAEKSFGGPGSSAGRQVLKASVLGPEKPVRVGDRFTAEVVLDIDPAYHVNSNPASDAMYIPTELTLEPAPDIEVGPVQYPTGTLRKFAFSEDWISVYEGRASLRVSGRVSESARAGERVLKGTLRYQACNNQSCLIPKTLPVRLTLRVAQ